MFIGFTLYYYYYYYIYMIQAKVGQDNLLMLVK